jgi:hypothetical protein
MPRINHRLGLGAFVSVKANALHPTRAVRARIANWRTRKVEDLEIVGYDVEIDEENVPHLKVHLAHEEFAGLSLEAFAGSVTLMLEGPEEGLFTNMPDVQHLLKSGGFHVFHSFFPLSLSALRISCCHRNTNTQYPIVSFPLAFFMEYLSTKECVSGTFCRSFCPAISSTKK